MIVYIILYNCLTSIFCYNFHFNCFSKFHTHIYKSDTGQTQDCNNYKNDIIIGMDQNVDQHKNLSTQKYTRLTKHIYNKGFHTNYH